MQFFFFNMFLLLIDTIFSCQCVFLELSLNFPIINSHAQNNAYLIMHAYMPHFHNETLKLNFLAITVKYIIDYDEGLCFCFLKLIRGGVNLS